MSFAENLIKIRNSFRLSQEEFATRISVSKKTIQNWESGTSIPDGINLMTLSKKFDVSIDTLLLGINSREKEEHFDKILPTKALPDWDCYEKTLDFELQQCEEEGKDISDYKNLIMELNGVPDTYQKARMADIVFDLVREAKQKKDYQYVEPSNYADIAFAVPNCPVNPYNKATIKDQLKGAWLGRICGCLLGKPVEGMKTEVLHPLLKATGNYPMTKYITYADITKNIEENSPLMQPQTRFWADMVEYAPEDDDTNYTVMSAIIIDKYGRDFTSSNVLDVWLKVQNIDYYFTAERIAWRNYFNGYEPPYTAIYKNPFREWIGAQIRVDYYGYINPGNVKEAVRMAYNDACTSHVKNGIYGAMYVAAMIAHAAVCQDRLEVVKVGISQIPQTSRLYEQVNKIIELYLAGKTQEECRNYIYKKFDEHNMNHFVHTISNALIVTMALLYNGGDFGRSICSAVETGFDTDCNGATVGSIIGMMFGTQAISAEWTAPICGKLRTGIAGYECVEIDKMVDMTEKHLKELRRGE